MQVEQTDYFSLQSMTKRRYSGCYKIENKAQLSESHDQTQRPEKFLNNLLQSTSVFEMLNPSPMNHCDYDFSYNITRRTYLSAPFTLLASCLSIFGSCVIIFSYLAWKDVRKSTARTIVFYLALADLGTSLSYLFSAIVYLVEFGGIFETKKKDWPTHIKLSDAADNFRIFCQIESIVDTYFPIVSFFWTMNLAVFFVMTLVFNFKPPFDRLRERIKVMLPFHMIAWGVPAIICIVGETTSWLVPTTAKGPLNTKQIEGMTAAAWCFVNNKMHNLNYPSDIAMYYGMEAVFGKGWEIASYFIVLFCYALVIGHNRCRFFPVRFCWENLADEDSKDIDPFRQFNSTNINQTVFKHLDLKLLFIPIAYIIVRLPGTLRYFVSFMHHGCSMAVLHNKTDSICINESCVDFLYNQELLDLQAICDPLQGFVNGVIFGFLSKTIIKKFCSIKKRCWPKPKRSIKFVPVSSHLQHSMDTQPDSDHDSIRYNDTSDDD